MRNTISVLCAATFLCLLCSSCSSSRQVSYLQKLNEEFRDTLIEYDAHIMPKDLLTISVSCSEPEAALPFNLVVPASQTGINSTNLVSQPTLQNYLVNNQGEIVFPVLGTLKVGGMTTQETSELIVGKLERYLKERPIVTVRLVNYKISVSILQKPYFFPIIIRFVPPHSHCQICIPLLQHQMKTGMRIFSETTFLSLKFFQIFLLTFMELISQVSASIPYPQHLLLSTLAAVHCLTFCLPLTEKQFLYLPLRH